MNVTGITPSRDLRGIPLVADSQNCGASTSRFAARHAAPLVSRSLRGEREAATDCALPAGNGESRSSQFNPRCEMKGIAQRFRVAPGCRKIRMPTRTL